MDLGASYDVYQVDIVNRDTRQCNICIGLQLRTEKKFLVHTSLMLSQLSPPKQTTKQQMQLLFIEISYFNMFINKYRIPIIGFLHSIYIFLTDRLDNTLIIVIDEVDTILNNSNTCNKIRDGNKDVVSVKCDYKGRIPPLLRGRYVMIRSTYLRYPWFILNFCEVEVLSCPPGRWGYNTSFAEDCSRTCGECVETCRVSDGYCYSGCRDGFRGDFCEQTTTTMTTPTTVITTKTSTVTAESNQATDTGGFNIGLVAGMVILSIVLIVGVVMGLFFYRR